MHTIASSPAPRIQRSTPAPISAISFRLVLVAAWTITLPCLASHADAQMIRQDFPVTDGAVYATVLSGNTLYIGGSFTRVGLSLGSVAPVDPTSGMALPGFPKFDGPVHAIVSDGSGG